MSESPTISDSPLTEDILCMRCGYNLRTRRPSEICPECALPVAPSIQYHADGSNIVPHPTLAALSLTFLAMAFGVRFLMTILYVLQPPFAAVRLLYYALALGDTFLLMASVFLLLFAQRSSRATTPLLRSLTSASLLAYAITNLLLIAYYAIHYLYWSLIRSPLRFTMSQWSIFAGTLLAGVTVIAFNFFFMLYLVRLSSALGSAGLRRMTVAIFLSLSLAHCVEFADTTWVWWEFLAGGPRLPSLSLHLALNVTYIFQAAIYATLVVYMLFFSRRVLIFKRKR